MLITRLRVKNWKNFREAQVRLQKRSFIVGPNASGKSNLLDALRFARDLAVEAGGLQSAASSRRPGFSLIRTLFQHGPRSHIEIELECQVEDRAWTYFLALERERHGDRAIVLKERVHLGGEVLLDRDAKADGERDEERRQTHLEQSAHNARYEELVLALRTIRYAHLVPQLLRTTKLHGDRDLEDYGSRFLERVAKTPQAARNKRLSRINKALKNVLPFFRKLALEKDELGHPHLQLRLKHWRTEDAYQDEGLLSDGTLRLIGLLWEIADGDGPLLLEEPELSLHGSAVRQLPALISTVAATRQVIVTSHAFAMFNGRGIDPSEIVLVRPGHGKKAEASVVENGADNDTIVSSVEHELELGRQLEQLTAVDDIEGLAAGVGG
ncbi:MAG: AAA family ATPase [Archangium sp.]